MISYETMLRTVKLDKEIWRLIKLSRYLNKYLDSITSDYLNLTIRTAKDDEEFDTLKNSLKAEIADTEAKLARLREQRE